MTLGSFIYFSCLQFRPFFFYKLCDFHFFFFNDFINKKSQDTFHDCLFIELYWPNFPNKHGIET